MPEQGLELVNTLMQEATAVLRDQFFANEAWKKKALSPAGCELSFEELADHVVAVEA